MRIIKKYPNRRLYDTEKSAYITLADVLPLIRGGIDFKVLDSETDEDITRQILVQIITEQEGGETPIFTTDMLTRFIRFYDDANQAVFGEFLDRNMTFFVEQQTKFSSQLENLMGSPLNMMKEFTERNLDLWQDMQRKFFDFAAGGGVKPDPDAPKPAKKKSKK